MKIYNMVKVREDMTGWKMWEHGVPDSRLIVVERAEDYVCGGKHYARWMCQCNCGNPNLKPVLQTNLKRGETLSCGCLRAEKVKQPRRKQGNRYDENIPGVGYCRNTGNPFYFDPEDYDKIKNYTWSDKWNDGYHELKAWDSDQKRMIWMYWLITGKECDHIDRNPMNNRKSNLRDATQSQQCQNRNKTRRNNSGIVGVCYNKEQDKWIAYISIDKKQINIGRFNNKEDAVKARLQAEADCYGKFSPQLHLFDKYEIIQQTDTQDRIVEYKKNKVIRPVVQLSISGEFIKQYNTMINASKETGIDYSVICACCKHPERNKTAGGFKWMYKEDYDNLHNKMI